MDDLASLRTRARRAADVGRARAALRVAPALAALIVLLAAVAPTPALTASIAGSVALAAIALRWWRRSLGRAATEGIAMGAPAALAGGLARACLATETDWSCGVACVVVGAGAAILSGLATAREERTRTAHAVTAAFGATTAFAGCAGFGAGVALMAALATAAAWSGTIGAHRLTHR